MSLWASKEERIRLRQEQGEDVDTLYSREEIEAALPKIKQKILNWNKRSKRAKVDSAMIFGSFAQKKDFVHDLDIAIILDRKSVV